jgi:hypothetical protein
VLGDALGPLLGDELGTPVGNELGLLLEEALGITLGDALDGVLGVVLGLEVEAALSLGDELGASLGAFSPSAVGDKLGEELGKPLGEPLGVVDGTTLGKTLGVKTGPLVGEAVARLSASLVGPLVGGLVLCLPVATLVIWTLTKSLAGGLAPGTLDGPLVGPLVGDLVLRSPVSSFTIRRLSGPPLVGAPVERRTSPPLKLIWPLLVDPLAPGPGMNELEARAFVGAKPVEGTSEDGRLVGAALGRIMGPSADATGAKVGSDDSTSIKIRLTEPLDVSPDLPMYKKLRTAAEATIAMAAIITLVATDMAVFSAAAVAIVPELRSSVNGSPGSCLDGRNIRRHGCGVISSTAFSFISTMPAEGVSIMKYISCWFRYLLMVITEIILVVENVHPVLL